MTAYYFLKSCFGRGISVCTVSDSRVTLSAAWMASRMLGCLVTLPSQRMFMTARRRRWHHQAHTPTRSGEIITGYDGYEY